MACDPKNDSPRPTCPASVCTRIHTTLGNSATLIVSMRVIFMCGLLPASRHLLELLQRAHPPRDRVVGEEPRILGVADLADIDVAAAVDGETMRRDELPRLEAGSRFAPE